MPLFPHDGLTFNYEQSGEGLPFVFQHGLAGDVTQPFGLFRQPPGIRLLAFDCRGHGETRPLGDPDKIGIASFADDLLALLKYLKIDRAVIGGISMGAAAALNFTLRFPKRVLGLVLVRPAWLDGPMTTNARIFGEMARLIREHGARRGQEVFLQSETYRRLLQESPESAISLAGQFEHSRAEETVVKYERIPCDAPVRGRDAYKTITVPTLVLANRPDVIHPFEYGRTIADLVPGAEFHEVASKSVSVDKYNADVQRAVEAFLRKNFLKA